MTDEATGRAAVIAEARKWLGTPYAPAQDLKGAGVDCGMILVRAFVDSGLVEPFDPRPYSPDWMLHRSEERYLGWVEDRLTQVQTPKPGDIAVYLYGRVYSHGGLITSTDPLTIVHAFVGRRSVIEEPVRENAELSDPKRKPLYFTLWPASS